MEFNPQKQLAGLLEWMDQQMTQCGGKTAVIGISGGKDSSTVAALAVAAYGRENVYGVLMPNGTEQLRITLKTAATASRESFTLGIASM